MLYVRPCRPQPSLHKLDTPAKKELHLLFVIREKKNTETPEE